MASLWSPVSSLAPEVILHLLSFLPPADVAATATVCQAWKEPALDVLWKDVNLKDLLEVLGTTKEQNGVLVGNDFVPCNIKQCLYISSYMTALCVPVAGTQLGSIS